jgi:outer membrane receptor protein involved in Fe transport
MPSVTLQGFSRQNNNAGQGLTMVDLRNLGTERTLVLVNGRRFVKSHTGDGVDLNNIPVALIERVEVLLDGASAAYGSDAIAGVINIILKEDFEGFQLDASAGVSGYGDGAELSISGTGGVSSDKGNFTINFTYYHADEIKQMDRDWAKYPVVFEDYLDDGPDADVTRLYGSGTTTRGRYIYPSVRDIDGDGVAGDLDNDWADIVMSEDGQSFSDLNSGGCNKSDGWDNCADPLGDRYNYGEAQWLVGSTERFSITGLGHYDFTENVKAYMEGTYTNRFSRNRLAAQPIGFGSSTYPDGFVMTLDNAGIPPALAADVNPGLPMLIGLRRMSGVGYRVYDNESDTFRIVTGAKGDITEEISWDVYFNYGHHQNLQITHNSVNRTRMEQTLDPDVCAAHANLGCVAGDYFGEGLPPALADYIRYSDHEVTGWDMYVLSGNLKGNLLELPGGMLSAVLGAETRKELGYTRPSAIVAGGESAGNALDATEGDYHNQELFAELSLPVLKDIPGADTLTLDLAGRYSHYNTFGSDMTYRAGLTWAPIKDVRFRGVFSTAFRAPDIGDLYGGVTVSYETLVDPCANWAANPDPLIQANCAAQGVPDDWTSSGSQIRTNIGGDPGLDSETATVFNVGLVVAPSFGPEALKGLSITFDYYNIEVDNAIVAPEPQWVLDTCYGSDGFSHPNCGLISDRNVNNEVTFIDGTMNNIAVLETSGLDFTVNYRFGMDLFGMKKGMLNIDLGYHGNYLLNYDETTTDPAGILPDTKVEYAGTITSNSGSYTHFRWNLYAVFSGEAGPGIWSFQNRWRYIGEAKVFGTEWDEDNERWDTPSHHVPEVVYWDVVLSYNWDDLSFIFGINNLLDKDPPFFLNGEQNANILTYDFIGRFFFTKIGYKF